MIQWTTTDDGCHIAEFKGRRSPKFGTRNGAANWLCEEMEKELQQSAGKRYPFHPTGPCDCDGWGHPTGCPGCGLRSMGG